MSKVRLTRRELIASAGAAGAVAAVPPAWAGQLLPPLRRIGPGAFLDGVASGDPSSTAITFWSRLDTPRPRSGARLVVAMDPGMRKVVAHAIVPTGRGVNGTLKTRIGGLKPSTEYYYVWESGTGVSPIGRTRTAPPPGSAQPLLLGFSSCQMYAAGYYTAHVDAAAQPLDLYVFLGDYIYEAKSRVGALRTDTIAAVDLASYRAKYALYRSDPALRELHRLHPTAQVWDDHEVFNDYTNNYPPPAQAQRWAGYRAAFEWLPRMSLPSDRHRVYKRIQLGAYADLFLLDERQYRTGKNDGQARHILGEAQMQWIIGSLQTSKAAWKLVGNPDQIATTAARPNPDGDAWDGYAADRVRLLGAIEAAGIDNVALFTGDSHVFMCNLLASDFHALAADPSRKPAGVEYLPGSVTSEGADIPESQVQADAPWNVQYNGHEHGYGKVAVAASQLTVDYMAADITNPNGTTRLLERFTQPSGVNRVQRESHASGRI